MAGYLNIGGPVGKGIYASMKNNNWLWLAKGPKEEGALSRQKMYNSAEPAGARAKRTNVPDGPQWLTAQTYVQLMRWMAVHAPTRFDELVTVMRSTEVGWGGGHAACCMLHAACCMLHAACCMLFFTCDMRHATCDMRHAACDMRHSPVAHTMQEDEEEEEERNAKRRRTEVRRTEVSAAAPSPPACRCTPPPAKALAEAALRSAVHGRG